MIEFNIIGAGWRTEAYLQIAAALQERFRIGAVLVRNAEKAEALAAKWHVKTVQTIGELPLESDSFTVVSVPWNAAPGIVTELVEDGRMALCETPPAPDLLELEKLNSRIGGSGRVQVAEQYHLQPLNAARQAVIDSGKLGQVSSAHVSVAHGYHGVSLIRRFLSIGFENACIRAMQFRSPIVGGPGRQGPPLEPTVTQSTQEIATLEFDGKLGIFDFTGDQYFSWIRSERVLVRGDNGEINNLDLRYLKDFRSPIHLRFERIDYGQGVNFGGYYHHGYQVGSEMVATNPLAPGRLSDDEIAIGACLLGMHAYTQGGPSFYSLAEASQDHYLGLCIDRAIKTGESVRTEYQSWAPDR